MRRRSTSVPSLPDPVARMDERILLPAACSVIVRNLPPSGRRSDGRPRSARAFAAQIPTASLKSSCPALVTRRLDRRPRPRRHRHGRSSAGRPRPSQPQSPARGRTPRSRRPGRRGDRDDRTASRVCPVASSWRARQAEPPNGTGTPTCQADRHDHQHQRRPRVHRARGPGDLDHHGGRSWLASSARSRRFMGLVSSSGHVVHQVEPEHGGAGTLYQRRGTGLHHCQRGTGLRGPQALDHDRSGSSCWRWPRGPCRREGMTVPGPALLLLARARPRDRRLRR